MANDVNAATDIIRFIESTPGWPEDVKRIQKVVKDQCGLDLNELQAELLWSKISDYLAATWLMLPEKDGQLWNEILHYVRFELNDK